MVVGMVKPEVHPAVYHGAVVATFGTRIGVTGQQLRFSVGRNLIYTVVGSHHERDAILCQDVQYGRQSPAVYVAQARLLVVVMVQTLFGGHPQAALVVNVQTVHSAALHAHFVQALRAVLLPRLRIAAVGEQLT